MIVIDSAGGCVKREPGRRRSASSWSAGEAQSSSILRATGAREAKSSSILQVAGGREGCNPHRFCGQLEEHVIINCVGDWGKVGDAVVIDSAGCRGWGYVIVINSAGG